jgi:hypothetical protein
MKKILLILLVTFTLSSCYTTFYPPEYMDMGNAESVPDSTRQIIINNYYETTEYYQVPHYRRYSLLWGDYYWDPFYYDYGYYNWRPYYYYGSYYYYNPHNHYWYYYDRYNNWNSGNWSGGGNSGGNSGGNADKGRIHKPGYNVLMNSPSGVAPFVSVGSDDNHITKPVGKVGVNVNSGITNNNKYTPNIQSVGKKPINGSSSSSNTVKNIKKTGSSYKPSSTSNSNKKSSSSSSYSKQKQSSNNNSSSSSSKSKSSSTNSTSSKNSSSESSSSTNKKSK